MPDVIASPSEEGQQLCNDEDMKKDTQASCKRKRKENKTPNKEADICIEMDDDIDKSPQVVNMPLKEKNDSTKDNTSESQVFIEGPEQLKRSRKKTKCKWHVCFISFLVISLVLGIIAILLNQMHHHKPHVKPAPVQFHHSFFHLKTDGYNELENAINLQWLKDDSQNVGSIKLINETYFYIPQDGLYQINFAVQLHIPKGTPASVITLMLQRKNAEKDYVFMKKTSSSLSIPEHDMVQSSFRYKLKANDLVFLRMNMAKFISRNKHSSYLYISRLNINKNE